MESKGNIRKRLIVSISNARRAIALASLHKDLKEDPRFTNNPAIDDVLRSSVVFTHATLEDFLRNISLMILPHAKENILDQIPLIGSNSRRPEKFYLGKLASHRGKTIDQIIEESISLYMEHTNYNNGSDVAQLLYDLQIEVKKVEHLLPTIDELMQRRHLIVHRADRKISSDAHDPQTIMADDVIKWFETVLQFIDIIMQELEIKLKMSSLD